MALPYIGEIRMFAGNFAPTGWAFCNGQSLAIAQNETLFQLIGTTYGGDGENTFSLPDLRGRLPIHQGQAPSGVTYQLAETGGVEELTLTVQQLPLHTHAPVAVDAPGSQVSPAGALPAQSFNVTPYLNDAPTGTFNAAAVTSAGANQPHDNRMPFLGLNFIISLFGIYPSQT
jgi:microcystin-dependent protein